jgi:acylphosphatase
MKKQLHLIYSGRVQGVGFRYTVLDIARQQKIGGWVKNLDYGRVEVVAEASEDALNNFLQSINQQFSGYIKDLDTTWLPANGELNVFEIKF